MSQRAAPAAVTTTARGAHAVARRCVAAALASLLAAPTALAQDEAAPAPASTESATERPPAPPPATKTTAGATEGPSYDLVASSRTYLRIFERALLPGPGGALVETDLLAPAHEYLYFRGDRIDTAWAEDSVGFELAGWTAVALAGDELGASPDGDLTIASVFQRVGPATLTFGRQVQAGGAARFSRFDGVAVDLRTASGVAATAYGGLTVLPRWSARPSYHHLGSAFDSLVESPDALPEPARSGYWLAGARLGYSPDQWLTAGVGFHEQRSSAHLDRREAALDLRVSPLDLLDLTGRLVADLGAFAVADATLAADVYPVEPLSVAAEFRHVTPSLLLPKQSVLSVFATDPFDELGTEVEWTSSERLVLGAGQWVELLGEGDVGARSELRGRVSPEASERVTLQLVYGLVVEPENGYHSTRVTARWQVGPPVALVAEHYAYFYREPINGVGVSSVEALNAEYAGGFPLRFLLGGTLAQTPYATNDAQVLLRVAYDVERMEGGT